MPAFAQFVTLHIGGSAFLKSLRSRLRGSGSRSRGGASSSKGGSNTDEGAPRLRTIGSERVVRKKNYYELTDTLLLDTQVTVTANASKTSQLSTNSSSHRPGQQFV